ncbi:MAG: PilZ domain-containing protein [Methylobacterium sp.]
MLIPAIAVCDGRMEYRCVLRDMSENGAKIGIPRRYRLPRQFRLVTGNRPDGFPVRLAWQRGDFAGLVLDLGAGAAETA